MVTKSKLLNFNSPHPDFYYFNQDDLDSSCDFQPPTRSEEFTLFISLGGSIKGRINLQNIEIKKGDVLLISPNALKQMINISPDSQYIGMIFRPSFLVQLGLPKHKQDIFKLLTDMRLNILSLSDAELRNLMVYMKNIEQNFKKLDLHLFAEEMIHHNFLSVFYELGDIAYRQNKMVPQKFSRKEDITMRFGSLALKHFKERKQLDFYASKVFVTPKYLTETVKEVTGKTAGEILDELLIREAKLMLEDPNLGISEIAIVLNFSDQSFFGKFFKRHVGSSPREFRANI